MMDEVRGWWSVQLLNRDHIDLNLSHAIKDSTGRILFLVTFDEIHYNMTNVVSMKRKEN